MGKHVWDVIKHSKNFYANSFRKAGSALLISLALNVMLGLAVFYVYITQPERNFYATNGITPPRKLTPMLSPNYASEAMLAPAPANNEAPKTIPQ